MRTGSLRKRVLVIAGVVVLVLVIAGAGAWRALQLSELATIGAGYAARQTCACMFISGRSATDCRGDLDRLAQRLVSTEATANTVTARSFLGVARATARYDKELGCSLDD